MTEFSDALRAYSEWLLIERGRSTNTVSSYESDLRQFVSWCETNGLDPLKISTSDLERYLIDLKVLKRAKSTNARVLSSIKGFFKFLSQEDGDNRFDELLRISAGRQQNLPKPLNESDISKLLDVACDSLLCVRDTLVLEFLYGTGCRVSELIAVQLPNIDFDEELVLLHGKGGKDRLVPMGRSLIAGLRSYIDDGIRTTFSNPKSGNWLFLNNRGGQLTRQGIDLIVKRRSLAVGVGSPVSAHSFRHSCATHMLAHGADIRSVQEMLGHASISTTQIYTGVTIDGLKTEYLRTHPRSAG